MNSGQFTVQQTLKQGFSLDGFLCFYSDFWQSTHKPSKMSTRVQLLDT